MKTLASKTSANARTLMIAIALAATVVTFPPATVPVSATEWVAPGNVNQRIAGTDRFDTAAAISRNLGTPTGGTVVVATGTNFPDSLSAAPLAGKLGAPLLLTTTNALPPATLTELRRLAPRSVIVIGGEPSVSAEVFSEIQRLPSAPQVRRIAGADRFETSAAIAAEWGQSVQNVFVVTGVNYPDALSAGPAAVSAGAPVLLVPGYLSQVPDLTKAVLDNSGAKRIYIAGSTASVTAEMEESLTRGSQRTVVARYAGPDRFETSQLIAASHFRTGVPTAYLATGFNFPDALAGATAAGIQGGPLLLVQQGCVPSNVYTQLDRVQPRFTYALGGEATLSQEILHGNECAPAIQSGVSATEAQASFQIYARLNAARFEKGVPAARVASPDRQAVAAGWSLKMAATPSRMATLNPNIQSQASWVKREYVQRNPTGSAADSRVSIDHILSSTNGAQFTEYQPTNARAQIAVSWVNRSGIGWLSLYAGA